MNWEAAREDLDNNANGGRVVARDIPNAEANRGFPQVSKWSPRLYQGRRGLFAFEQFGIYSLHIGSPGREVDKLMVGDT